MIISTVEAFDLNDAWFKCLKEVLEHGTFQTVERGSYEGTRRLQLDFITLHIERPGIRPLAPYVPPGILPPTDEDYIERYAAEYLLSPDVPANEIYTYGNRLHDQLLSAIDCLQQTPVSNHLVLEIAQPSDFRIEDHPPCMRLIQFQVHNGWLDMYVYFRSWDCYGGLPVNLGGLQIVKEFICGETGYLDGTITAISPGLHLWEFSIEHAKARVYGQANSE